MKRLYILATLLILAITMVGCGQHVNGATFAGVDGHAVAVIPVSTGDFNVNLHIESFEDSGNCYREMTIAPAYVSLPPSRQVTTCSDGKISVKSMYLFKPTVSWVEVGTPTMADITVKDCIEWCREQNDNLHKYITTGLENKELDTMYGNLVEGSAEILVKLTKMANQKEDEYYLRKQLEQLKKMSKTDTAQANDRN